VALWIIGEYAHSKEEVDRAFASIKRNVGSLPIFPDQKEDALEDSEAGDKGEEESKEKTPKVITKTVVLPDGSYGTQTIVVDDGNTGQPAKDRDESSYLPMRKALMATEDDYLSTCLAITLTKLVIKSKRNMSKSF